jgi:hypothetical protein
MFHSPESDRKTVYQCRQGGELKGTADTETEAIEWLERNGGGVYRHQLHRFDMPVKSRVKA